MGHRHRDCLLKHTNGYLRAAREWASSPIGLMYDSGSASRSDKVGGSLFGATSPRCTSTSTNSGFARSASVIWGACCRRCCSHHGKGHLGRVDARRAQTGFTGFAVQPSYPALTRPMFGRPTGLRLRTLCPKHGSRKRRRARPHMEVSFEQVITHADDPSRAWVAPTACPKYIRSAGRPFPSPTVSWSDVAISLALETRTPIVSRPFVFSGMLGGGFVFPGHLHRCCRDIPWAASLSGKRVSLPHGINTSVMLVPLISRRHRRQGEQTARLTRVG
ncbi:hypothetical protein BV25DRAFT_1537896 [Artomyces pyxidatus]|uniref:Uncharacterized protein n=1 Tax=Artomyces pyxidatus TaxID=48021 RepID=A0ACB8SK85_9AGAM|nr:hypothetical protein BV25DRAFT_1537896 [Artomyces pyxidatus]